MPPMIDLDHVPYLRYFLAGLVIALAAGAGLFARGRSRHPVNRLALFLCPAAVYLTLALAALGVAQAPDNDWEAARLAPSVALLSGAKMRRPRRHRRVDGHDLPAGRVPGLRPGRPVRPGDASDHRRVVHQPGLYLAPAAVLGFWPGRGGSGGRPTLLSVACLLVLLQASLASKSLVLAAFNIHADAPTLGFAGLAALTLYLRRQGEPTSRAACLASAGFASMAIGASWPPGRRSQSCRRGPSRRGASARRCDTRSP